MSNMLEFALDTARMVGRILCEPADGQRVVGRKSSEIDLVTEADLASERFIIDAIRRQFPDHKVFSEEGLGDVTGQDLEAQLRDIDHLCHPCWSGCGFAAIGAGGCARC